jgi:hypothetical protein
LELTHRDAKIAAYAALRWASDFRNQRDAWQGSIEALYPRFRAESLSNQRMTGFDALEAPVNALRRLEC